MTGPTAVAQEWHIQAEHLAELRRTASGQPKPLFPSVEYLRAHHGVICSAGLVTIARPAARRGRR